MPFLYFTTIRRMLVAFGVVLLFSLTNIHAQRIEVHANKDLSNHEIVNKSWGCGGAIDLDQWVKKTTFRLNFNWAQFRNSHDIKNPRYRRLSGGVSVFYSFAFKGGFSTQVGAEVQYSNLIHTYIYDYEMVDSLRGKPLTLKQTGNFIGIGPHIGVRYDLSPRFCVALNFVPSYLIPVGAKSSNRNIEPEFAKAIWIYPIQLGLSFKLFNNP